MKNGLYCVVFATQRGAGAGVVVLRDGKVQGGDSSLYYDGTYQLAGTDLTGTVAVKRHTAGLPSVFGVDNLTINLKGTSNSTGDHANVVATSPQAPSVSLKASLRLLSTV